MKLWVDVKYNGKCLKRMSFLVVQSAKGWECGEDEMNISQMKVLMLQQTENDKEISNHKVQMYTLCGRSNVILLQLFLKVEGFPQN